MGLSQLKLKSNLSFCGISIVKKEKKNQKKIIPGIFSRGWRIFISTRTMMRLNSGRRINLLYMGCWLLPHFFYYWGVSILLISLQRKQHDEQGRSVFEKHWAAEQDN